MQSWPRFELPPHKARALTERIQDAGTEVVKAKARFLQCMFLHPRLTSYTTATDVMFR
jgi:hypothetical protein